MSIRIDRPQGTIPRALRQKTKADIVFCVDATASMNPCFQGILESLSDFSSGLESAADVDYRLKLIAYRDRHDPACGVPWDIGRFTSSTKTFEKEVNSIVPNGGGDAPESTLDAIYLAATSDWRDKAHRTIVVMTDDDTHPTLSKTTYARPDNGVDRVIQELQTLRHSLLFLVAPNFPTYQKLERSMVSADRKVVAKWVPYDDIHKGLNEVDWTLIMGLLGQSVSSLSIDASLMSE